MYKWKRIGSLLVLVFILALAFVLRFSALDHPLAHNGGEGFRDLLTAKHALLYGEWPLAGHAAGLSTIDNSPLYYYLVTLLALPSPDFFTVGLFYVLFQCAVIGLLFFCTRAWFGTAAALIAAFLMAISPYYVTNVTGYFVWPPYFVAPFVIGAFYLFSRAQNKKSKFSLVFGVLLVIAGSAVHQALLLVFPLLAVVVIRMMRSLNFTRSDYWRTVVLIFLLLALLFIPTIVVSDLQHISWGSRLVDAYPVGTGEGIQRMFFAVSDIFGLALDKSATMYIATLVAALGSWFMVHAGKRERMQLATIVLLFVVHSVLVIILDPSGIPRHLDPLLWVVFVALGVVLARSFREHLVTAGVATIALTLLITSAVTDARLLHTYPNIGVFDRPHYEAAYQAAEAIAAHVSSVRTEELFSDFTFFDVYTYGDTNFEVSPLGVWFFLEEILNMPLAESPNETLNRAHRAHADKRLILVCLKHRPEYSREVCLKDYQERFPQHRIVDTVFSNPDITVYYAIQEYGRE